MKKTSLSFMLFFGTMLSILAQNTSVGFRVGLNSSSVASDPVLSNQKSLIGINLGGFLMRSIHQNWGITGELNFSAKGIKADNGTTNLNYIEVPVYLNYYFTNPNQTWRPKLFVGGYWGYFLESIDGQKNVYEASDLGLVLGGGLHYKLGKTNWLIVDVRYGFGLMDIAKGSTVMNNRTWSFNLGYSFPFGNTQ